MPYAKVEPKGCVERHGNVQVKLSFYLEPGDARYDEHHVRVGSNWRTNPFHNHMIHVSPETTDEEIEVAARLHLHNFYAAWASHRDIVEGWHDHRQPVRDYSPERRQLCEARVVTIRRDLPSLTLRDVA